MTFWINGARTIVIGRTCRCMICMCLYSLGDYNVRLIESQSLTMTCGVPESRLGISEGLPLLPYGDKFNLHRKLLQQPFSKRGCDKFLDLQAKQRSICLQSLLRSPHEFEQHTKRFVFYFRFSRCWIWLILHDSLHNARLSCVTGVMIRYIAAGIIGVTFGHEVLSDDDYFLKMANNVNDILGGVGVPGTSAIDVFPIRKSSNSGCYVTAFC